MAQSGKGAEDRRMEMLGFGSVYDSESDNDMLTESGGPTESPQLKRQRVQVGGGAAEVIRTAPGSSSLPALSALTSGSSSSHSASEDAGAGAGVASSLPAPSYHSIGFMSSDESDESDAGDSSDDEVGWGDDGEGFIVDDDEFHAYLARNEKMKTARQAAREEKKRNQQEEHDRLTSPRECHGVVERQCDCYIACPLRAQLQAASVQRERKDTLQHPLHTGQRLRRVYEKIKAVASADARHWPVSGTVGCRQRKDGSQVPRNKIHMVLNGIDVCQEIFADANGVSVSMVQKAAAMARAFVEGRPVDPVDRRANRTDDGAMLGTACEHEAFESGGTLHMVVWVLYHVKNSGAELIPFHNFTGMKSVHQVLQKVLSMDEMNDLQGTCKVRLSERLTKDLYERYQEGGKDRFTVLDITTFRKIFKHHPRLAHIALARNTENFGQCTHCANTAQRLAHESNPAERWRIMAERIQHLDAVALLRRAYSRRAQMPKVDRVGKAITCALSIVVDKPTKQSTQAPAMPGGRVPKSMGPRMSYPIQGAIVHGFGDYAFGLSTAVTQGADATIECVYWIISDIQNNGHREGEGYSTPPKLYLQFDNHSDNKTPVVIMFGGWLVDSGIFDEVELNMLWPGHSHIDVDQKFAAWIRRILNRWRRHVTRSRIMKAIQGSKRQDAMRPRVFTEVQVRDWTSFFGEAMNDVDLKRMSMSKASNEGVYKFIIKKGSKDEVLLTYRQSDVEAAVYPCPYSHQQRLPAGEIDGQPHPVGTVVRRDFNESTGLWDMTVQSDDPSVAWRFSEPNGAIILFKEGTKPEGLPKSHTMDPAYPSAYAKIKRSLTRAFGKDAAAAADSEIAWLSGTPGAWEEWAEFFQKEDERITLCQQDGGAFFRGPPPPALLRFKPESQLELVPLSLQRAPFLVNPITWRGFTPEDRNAAVVASTNIRTTVVGGLVAMQLLWGSQVPEHHTAPFVLALVPESYGTSDTLPFRIFYQCKYRTGAATATNNAGGKWCEGIGMVMHKQQLLCGGLQFTPLVR
mmetsp:Transcript_5800/g.13416  ORF Transcript_5800/g.13416 Transcript_5800/m.13416 type:complete len:1027 (+) Transcript_5800:117-3197(+)|eukprot:CAMPEP_0182556158 /NCGR_PEP_ID=MMETSP1324-20130603/516_1 /TAXON_ID=236786 /ORGANISM="Florenciella sp., Strain RCC1587" /LENGTH=1026 /DNA_ID=CAMNT_0024768005 /DNA_START=78 /DNA_END=3158 /DNA_ORIENTATION=+